VHCSASVETQEEIARVQSAKCLLIYELLLYSSSVPIQSHAQLKTPLPIHNPKGKEKKKSGAKAKEAGNTL
jgi:hypothetical protein